MDQQGPKLDNTWRSLRLSFNLCMSKYLILDSAFLPDVNYRMTAYCAWSAKLSI